MSGCGHDHHEAAAQLAREAVALLRAASGPEQTAMFQKQALGLTAVAQVHATLASGGWACDGTLPEAQEPSKFPWDDPA